MFSADCMLTEIFTSNTYRNVFCNRTFSKLLTKASNVLAYHLCVFGSGEECGIHTKQRCYPLAFGVPAALMAVALGKLTMKIISSSIFSWGKRTKTISLSGIQSQSCLFFESMILGVEFAYQKNKNKYANIYICPGITHCQLCNLSAIIRRVPYIILEDFRIERKL